MPRSTSRTRRTAGVIAALCLLTTAPQRAAAADEPVRSTSVAPATTHAIDTTDRAAVLAAFNQRYLPLAQTPASWSGSVSGCKIGSETAASRRVAVDAVSYYRAMVGLPPAVEEPAWSTSALQASLMMLANGKLSHSPDASWRCHSAVGQATAGRASLSMNYRSSPAAHISAYVGDADPSNAMAGHRAWVLDPRAQRMGTGTTYQTEANGYVRSANALADLDPSSDRLTRALPAGTPTWLTWPNAGYTPWLLTPRWPNSSRSTPPTALANWSVAYTASRNADFSKATVGATAGGESLGVELHPLPLGYGSVKYRTFSLTRPGGAAFNPSADLTVTVTVSGVTVGGTAVAPYSYTVRLIGQPPHGKPRNTSISYAGDTATVTWDPPAAVAGAVPVDTYRVGFYVNGRYVFKEATASSRRVTFTGVVRGAWYHAYVTASTPFDSVNGDQVSLPHNGPSTPTTTKPPVTTTTVKPTTTTTKPPVTTTTVKPTTTTMKPPVTTTTVKPTTTTTKPPVTTTTKPPVTTTTTTKPPVTTTTTTAPPVTPTVTFGDIPTGSAYQQAVDWLVDAEITSGCTPTQYCPGDSVTRAQMAAFLWRFSGKQAASPHRFTDVAAGDYFGDAVSWLVAAEVTSGCTPSTYCPADSVTRAQMAAFLWRTAGSPRPRAATTRFPDVAQHAYYADATEWLAENEVTLGAGDGRYRPADPVSRSQMALFLHRLDRVIDR